ncbi:hypothetical protein EZS27_031889 [termite gut metagenome]|uniref:Uncharacterized protein n=1 Tax=termite gut metagenome TaxID=433724 RepID=A0A5J4Q9A9_9ZZZZ
MTAIWYENAGKAIQDKLKSYSDDAQTSAEEAQSTATTAKAVTDNFTTINGGLVMTTLIKMIRKIAGVDVETGGLSANIKNDSGYDNIILWGGGTYAQALANLAKIILRHDGSAKLGKMTIDVNGNITANDAVMNNITATGKIISNDSGNKIVMDPTKRAILLQNGNGEIIGTFYFFENAVELLIELAPSTPQYQKQSVRVYPNGITIAGDGGGGSPTLTMTKFRISLTSANGLEFSVNENYGSLDVNMKGLSTSAASLPSGRLWRDGTTLRIVP